MLNTPDWSKNVSSEIAAKAIKDHSCYKGLEVSTTFINFAPNGWYNFQDPIRVRIGDIMTVERSSYSHIDCFWLVDILPEYLKYLPVSCSQKLDSYIQAITYCLEDEVPVEHYRCFSGG